jgi:hypothetical protein
VVEAGNLGPSWDVDVARVGILQSASGLHF